MDILSIRVYILIFQCVLCETYFPTFLKCESIQTHEKTVLHELKYTNELVKIH